MLDFTQLFTIAIRMSSESAPYGALWLVVIITSRPLFLKTAKARSNASMSSWPPLVPSMSKHTPANPASFSAAIGALPSTKSSSIGPTSQSGALAPPPSERYCAPRWLGFFARAENGGAMVFLSSSVIRHCAQLSTSSMVALRASSSDLPVLTA